MADICTIVIFCVGSFSGLSDDNSTLTANCDKWGYSTANVCTELSLSNFAPVVNIVQ